MKFEGGHLRLEITPHVIDGKNMKMKIIVKKDEVDTTRNVEGNPFIIKKKTETSLIVQDGETIVISGLTKQTNTVGDTGIPLFKDVPILGWLFKSESKDNGDGGGPHLHHADHHETPGGGGHPGRSRRRGRRRLRRPGNEEVGGSACSRIREKKERSMKRYLAAFIILAGMVILFAGCATDPYRKGFKAYRSGDYATAKQELTALAERGDAEAQLHLGLMYRDGQGVMPDPREAEKWLQRSAEQGNATARIALGIAVCRPAGFRP